MAHLAYSPVGYTYNADMYCLDCIAQVIAPGRDSKRNGYAVAECNCAECRLDRIAALWGLKDRYDEYSFDSSQFPKAIPYHNDLHAECGSDTWADGERHCGAHCAACGDIIDGPCPALEESE